jgi:hypothetical protein
VKSSHDVATELDYKIVNHITRGSLVRVLYQDKNGKQFFGDKDPREFAHDLAFRTLLESLTLHQKKLLAVFLTTQEAAEEYQKELDGSE